MVGGEEFPLIEQPRSPLLELVGVTLLGAGREGGLVKEGAQGRPALEGSDYHLPQGFQLPSSFVGPGGDPELSSSIDITVVGAFTNRFLFLSPLVSRPSAGATEIGEAGMGSAIASTSEDASAAHRLLARASSLCRLSLSEVISASVQHGKGLACKGSRKQKDS